MIRPMLEAFGHNGRMAPSLRPWQRVLGRIVATSVGAVLWGIPSAILLTGIVLWNDWHALARRGADGTGLVQRCEWKTSGGTKRLQTPSSGYYSCTYTYRTSPEGPVHEGYFQSQRERGTGDAVAIRFLPDRPGTSAAAENLEHPGIAPGGMIAVGLALLAWTARGMRKKRTGPS